MEKGRQFTANSPTSVPPELRVIVPAHQAEATLGLCLDAIFAAGFARQEVLVIDDGSRDATSAVAASKGVRVIRNDIAQRPAKARNRGAAEAGGDVLVFIDSDVVVHPGLRNALLHHFKDPSLVGVIGSYDAAPDAPSVVSRYRNLLHHATHQDAAGDTPTFWSGLGAMRRDAFEAAGGYDSSWEDIEDVELGLRVTAAGGRILLDPTLQGTHLKDWTVRGMMKTDIYGRAVPWTRLMLSGRLARGVMNTSAANRVSALSVVAVPAMLVLSLLWPAAMQLAVIAAAAFLIANGRLLWRLARAGGAGFALQALPYHVLHYVAALTGYAKVRLFERSSA